MADDSNGVLTQITRYQKKCLSVPLALVRSMFFLAQLRIGFMNFFENILIESILCPVCNMRLIFMRTMINNIQAEVTVKKSHCCLMFSPVCDGGLLSYVLFYYIISI